MRDLLASDDARAAEAVELFCYQARKHIGSLATVLGGLDTLVFTGGIGEHAASIRLRICDNLEHLGVELDRSANDAGAALVSSPRGRVAVRVLATDEDLMIARHTRELLEVNEQ
jgi:acetate kinase